MASDFVRMRLASSSAFLVDLSNSFSRSAASVGFEMPHQHVPAPLKGCQYNLRSVSVEALEEHCMGDCEVDWAVFFFF